MFHVDSRDDYFRFSFYIKKISKLNFLKKNRNQFKPTGFGLARFFRFARFFFVCSVFSGLARFFPGLARFFPGLGSVQFFRF